MRRVILKDNCVFFNSPFCCIFKPIFIIMLIGSSATVLHYVYYGHRSPRNSDMVTEADFELNSQNELDKDSSIFVQVKPFGKTRPKILKIQKQVCHKRNLEIDHKNIEINREMIHVHINQSIEERFNITYSSHKPRKKSILWKDVKMPNNSIVQVVLYDDKMQFKKFLENGYTEHALKIIVIEEDTLVALSVFNNKRIFVGVEISYKLPQYNNGTHLTVTSNVSSSSCHANPCLLSEGCMLVYFHKNEKGGNKSENHQNYIKEESTTGPAYRTSFYVGIGTSLLATVIYLCYKRIKSYKKNQKGNLQTQIHQSSNGEKLEAREKNTGEKAKISSEGGTTYNNPLSQDKSKPRPLQAITGNWLIQDSGHQMAKLEPSWEIEQTRIIRRGAEKDSEVFFYRTRGIIYRKANRQSGQPTFTKKQLHGTEKMLQQSNPDELTSEWKEYLTHLDMNEAEFALVNGNSWYQDERCTKHNGENTRIIKNQHQCTVEVDEKGLSIPTTVDQKACEAISPRNPLTHTYQDSCSSDYEDTKKSYSSLPDHSDLLDKLASEIPHKWEQFGTMVGLKEGCLRGIEADITSSQKRFMEVIYQWRKLDSEKAPFTWSTVITVLKSKALDETGLAGKLENEFMKN